MEANHSPIESLFEKTENYAKAGIELIKLKAIDKFADILSSLLSNIVVISFITIFFFIFNVGLSLWIGEMLGKSYFGFFIVSGFYCFVGILLYIFRNKWLKTPINNSIINQALK